MDVDSRPEAAGAPRKQWGFSVREPLPSPRRPSPQTIKEASVAEERGEVEPWGVSKGGFVRGLSLSDGPSDDSWALPAQWRSSSPFALGPEASNASSSELTHASGFKSFKDSCEAGSFTLSPSQALRENGRLEVVGTTHTSPGVRNLVKAVVGGLRAWQQPEAAAEGLGGTYFFLDEAGRKTAIVKPCDEEPMAPNNPKGFVGRALGEPGLKPTVRVGEAAMREVAAFLLDYDQFAKVPNTVFVRVTHNAFHVAPDPASAVPAAGDSMLSGSQGSSSSFVSNMMASTIRPQTPTMPPSKLASLQEFVDHHRDASEMGFSRFPVADVHRIGILDLRLFNTDRHAGNLLVKISKPSPAVGAGGGGAPMQWLDEQYSLVPIDHGFCLPEALEPPYLEWLHWPQAKIPFDEEELAYIASLDAAADAAFLEQELPWLSEGSLRTLQVATLLLTRCAKTGLTLSEIGCVASRPLVGMEEESSELEKCCLAAREAVDLEMSLSEEEDSDVERLPADMRASLHHLEVGGAARTGIVMGRQVPLQSALSGDELLFDLEGASSGSGPSSPTHATSPLRPMKSCGPLSPLRSGLQQGPGGVAQSHMTGLHPMASQHFKKRRHRNHAVGVMKASPSKTRPTRPAYPPPVVGAAASGMNDVFKGLDRQAWASFMRALDEIVEEKLSTGVWKEKPDTNSRPGFGVSCPRF